jgi:hypothetical protein
MRVLSISYRAASPNQSITVSVGIQTDHGGGTLSLEAASLSSGSQPTATATRSNTPSATPSSTSLATATNTGTATATSTAAATATNTPTSIAIGTLTPTAIPGSGTLTGSNATDTAQVNLTTEGSDDWAHWGLFTAASFDHKASVTQQIPQFTLPTGGTAARFTPFPVSFTWTDGTPTASTTTPSGDYLVGIGHSFQLVLPADGTATRTLKLHLGAYRVLAQVTAILSDGSAAPVSISQDNTAGTTSMRVFSISYRAAGPGQSITVNVGIQTDHGGGTLSLEAASLTHQ